MNFAINFDLTIVKPGALGANSAYDKAVETIKKLQAAGHKFILMTSRTGEDLADAEAWLDDMGIVPDAINLGIDQEIEYVIVPGVEPDPDTATVTPYKIDADYFIDNKSLGGFTKIDQTVVSSTDVDYSSPRTDWDQVQKFLVYAKIFTEAELAA